MKFSDQLIDRNGIRFTMIYDVGQDDVQLTMFCHSEDIDFAKPFTGVIIPRSYINNVMLMLAQIDEVIHEAR